MPEEHFFLVTQIPSKNSTPSSYFWNWKCSIACGYSKKPQRADLITTGVEEVTQADDVAVVQLPHDLQLTVLKRQTNIKDMLNLRFRHLRSSWFCESVNIENLMLDPEHNEGWFNISVITLRPDKNLEVLCVSKSESSSNGCNTAISNGA